jgi:hypothetical protein
VPVRAWRFKSSHPHSRFKPNAGTRGEQARFLLARRSNSASSAVRRSVDVSEAPLAVAVRARGTRRCHVGCRDRRASLAGGSATADIGSRCARRIRGPRVHGHPERGARRISNPSRRRLDQRSTASATAQAPRLPSHLRQGTECERMSRVHARRHLLRKTAPVRVQGSERCPDRDRRPRVRAADASAAQRLIGRASQPWKSCSARFGRVLVVALRSPPHSSGSREQPPITRRRQTCGTLRRNRAYKPLHTTRGHPPPLG